MWKRVLEGSLSAMVTSHGPGSTGRVSLKVRQREEGSNQIEREHLDASDRTTDHEQENTVTTIHQVEVDLGSMMLAAVRLRSISVH